MNIYILTTTINTYLAVDLIVRDNSVKGLITLSASSANQINEYYSYKAFCEERNIECIELENYSMRNERERLEKLSVDLLIVIGWQRLIPKWLIDICSIGVIGGHGSPWGIEKGRGRSPQNWALILGETHFEASIFWINEGADSGEIIDTACFSYNEADDIGTSYIKYSIEFARMITKNLKNGNIQKKFGNRQDGDIFYLPKRTREDGAVDWTKPCKEIYNFVRALSKPYPGAFCKCGNGVAILWEVKYYETIVGSHIKPGRVISVMPNGEFLVACTDGFIIVRDYTLVEVPSITCGMVLESVDFSEQLSRVIERHYANGGERINPELVRYVTRK